MTEKTLDRKTIDELAQKLDQFSEVLSPDEHAVLLGLIGTAGSAMEASHAGAETEGVTADRAILARPEAKPLPKLSGALKDTFKSVPQLGGGGAGPISDSVGVGWLCVSWSKDYNETMPGGDVIQPGTLRVPGMKTYR